LPLAFCAGEEAETDCPAVEDEEKPAQALGLLVYDALQGGGTDNV